MPDEPAPAEGDEPEQELDESAVREPRLKRTIRRALKVRARRVDVLVASLLLVLGFALAVQVRSTQHDDLLTGARPEDLVQILDELQNRSARLQLEVESLNATKQRLTTGSGARSAALAEARRRTQLLGVLAGTLPASGPGVLVRITDPQGSVSASVMLDALEELRNAGAEAVQIEGAGPEGGTVAVRVVAQTALA
ncbi:MAG: division initiation protein, partial [Bryobacterales bacterium]|nr:division initiation protein [Bryobacterales bacterium]